MGHNRAASVEWTLRVGFLVFCLTMAWGVDAWSQSLSSTGRQSAGDRRLRPRAQTPRPTTDRIVLDNHRLGINVQDQELQDILKEVAAQGRIALRHFETLPPKRISIRFADLPVVDGLKRLFRAAEIDNYVLVTKARGDEIRVQRIRFFPPATRSGGARRLARPGRRYNDTASVFDEIKTNTAARRLLSQLMHPNEQVRERVLERLVRLVKNDDKQAELLDFLEPLMEDLSSEYRTDRDEARQEIRKLLRR